MRGGGIEDCAVIRQVFAAPEDFAIYDKAWDAEHAHRLGLARDARDLGGAFSPTATLVKVQFTQFTDRVLNDVKILRENSGNACNYSSCCGRSQRLSKIIS